MHVLTVKAFADFDIPYSVNMAVMEDGSKLKTIAQILNKFCSCLPDKNNDVLLKKYLVHKHWVEELRDDLTTETKVDKSNIDLLVENLLNICENNSVYIYDNIFATEEVPNLI